MKKDFNEFKEFIVGKKVGVVGIGVSNIPLINFLIDLGAAVTAFDKKSLEELGDVAEGFNKRGVKLELGEKYLDNLKGFDVIFKTPSMRIDSEALVRVRKEGAYVTSEMEEFVRYTRGKVYGITGSDGKTTTTTIISKLLEGQGYKTWVGGNIGTPLFSEIENIHDEDKVVLELSSFQLMTMTQEIDVAVCTNLSPNHLDMHKSMKEYIDAKKNIFIYQNSNGLLVVNRENEITHGFIKEAKGNVKEFSSKRELIDGAYYKNGILYLEDKEVCKKDDIVIKGMHNVENYLAAFLATKDDVSVEVMKKVAETFAGVEHRCELVREIDRVKYYNDSIASSPTRTLAGLRAFDEKVIVIAGGYDKNIPFEPLAYEGYPYIKELILMGATKHKIKDVFDNLENEKGIKININMVESLEEAVRLAESIANPGDIVTLSPACASFDMYPNFMIRGNKFKEIVKSL
ncbi:MULTISPECIES: UDP-N-acetylmuramoyl-L-alanine--D-glutamate ligase [Clostridium]|jgi:UDP-N-acetylmuramoylalanine--D-glutamate ligase|uniref:UDP-N-acetylmuramoylalanine--D-glutamate ligase n=2 Tax=Clostridium beijerinckii TaxID=1520 RepID=A0AB74VGB6_CLOBE|nr:MULTISPECIES: UDP-N-acetylmuramoyl-L-alanine--D-glutamate ligase [Clostridium]ALB48504.1 UDP-N-acetylmuramoyl-L-alanine--D-glutamate ligase [Clostridium beijerinckii NRRL B-598]AVK49161.1 UDP-N-acetylmuramoylalanine--D-glutamate ligase [Clostridium sp. MF28]MBC2459877.1 UDP-N-acetylmuramoyl-L-alanine--D-glutamate ligase [Clostridium beijerinckii]MBC2477397.1 UDP-N-acetylmuramoyl-L-alanine--D-glutamate ligase [Clostridium beijerinckii]MCI1478847.1 UDP-N-acetylmuramoyl-L-alanine--D-glutamate 